MAFEESPRPGQREKSEGEFSPSSWRTATSQGREGSSLMKSRKSSEELMSSIQIKCCSSWHLENHKACPFPCPVPIIYFYTQSSQNPNSA